MLLADVTVPWGDWATNALNVLQPVATLALTGIASYVMAAYLPPWLKMLTGGAAQARVNEVLQKAVSSAFAQAQAAVAGGQTTLNIPNPLGYDVISKAVQYAVNQAPDLIKSASQGKIDNLIKMIMARMQAAGLPLPDGNVNKVKDVLKDDTDFSRALSTLGGTPPPAAPKPTQRRTLQMGDQGEQVKVVQQKLGITPDGNFGPATDAAVKAFQGSHGLAADGIVGPSTWKALG